MMPTIQKIYSENNTFQYVETLRRNREKRHRHQEFFVEGVRPINQVLAYQWTVTAFLYSPDKPLSDWARNILNRSRARFHYELPRPLFEKLSIKNEPSELLAVVVMPGDDLVRIPIKPGLCIVIFDRPANPGNLGTIIRSCDALHVDGLVITGHSVDVYDPETISATTGSLFALPVIRKSSLKDLLPWFETIHTQIGSFQLVGSSEDATIPISDHDFTGPTMLVVGNETWGINAGYKERCNSMVSIPMGGSASSLNVACATSIILYEINRQRHNQSRQER